MVQGIDHREKCYVEVVARHGRDGGITPLSIEWEDGRRFDIDRVSDRRFASSMKVGGCGIRYTVHIGPHARHLWQDDTGRWYVEALVAPECSAM